MTCDLILSSIFCRYFGLSTFRFKSESISYILPAGKSISPLKGLKPASLKILSPIFLKEIIKLQESIIKKIRNTKSETSNKFKNSKCKLTICRQLSVFSSQRADFEGIKGALKKEEALPRDGTLWLASHHDCPINITD
jgi:hypothetical protein